MDDEPANLELVLALCTGLGLATACGLRVFVPLLALSWGARAGALELSGELAWLASTPLFWALAFATLVEVLAYAIPGLDHLLDIAATPAAAVAGMLVAVASFASLDPGLRWSLGIVAGGSLATLVQLPSVGARTLSTAATAGAANPGFSAGELLASTLVSVLAVLAPIVAPMVILALVLSALALLRRGRRSVG